MISIRLLSASLVLASAGASASVDISGSAGVEARYFFQEAAYQHQDRAQQSLFVEPEFYTEWNDGTDSVLFRPFARVDSADSERSHIDIRELQWLHLADTWETRVGVGKVFWGQTESLHLVDIINQTDGVEGVDGEDKLGQPMINYRTFGDWGTLSAYVLPYFRERTFPGEDGRLRPPLPIDGDAAIYESGAEEHHVDYALRWQKSMGDWEVGLSWFDGTSREPELIAPGVTPDELKDVAPVIGPNGEPVIVPYYAQINQFGVDLLKVQGAWLLKFEGIYRTGQSEDFTAMVAGFERTSVGVFGTQYDLGLLVEYQYDERDDNFFATGQNDIMAGVRWNLNDIDGTEVLAGVIQDLDESDTYSAFIEASSRMTDAWRWRLDGYFFSSNNPTETYYFVRRDDHVQFTLEYFF
ncbi:hypothetical protein [Alteromonas salexigens]|uniref:hypothetical protein n=1 Tax=Alteromonas salexigens TaxID=2982530 RepID=UPI0027E4630C|nr:hypothetical protein [Alteromonas salexigens]